jgi:hypothetical protein
MKENNILDQFENLGTIEPSSEWDERFFNKLSHSSPVQGKNYAGRMIIYAMVLLFAINIFSFIESRHSAFRYQKLNSLKNIASELLISTNSAKY